MKIYRQAIQALDKSTDDYLYVYDLNKNQIFFTDKICKRYPILMKEGTGLSMEEWISHVYIRDRSVLEENLKMIREGQGKVHDMEYRLLDRAGDKVWIKCRGSVDFSENGEPEVLAGCVSETAFGHKVDRLTGLKNMDKFLEDIENQKRLSDSYLLILGIDDFKKVNIKNGRIFGNQVLKELAELLEEYAEYPLKLYRLDGDHFAVIFPEKSQEEVEGFYETVKKRIEHKCTVSAGAVVCRMDSKEDGDTLYQYGENALDLAKEQGKNMLVFFSSEDYQKNLERIRLQDEIKEAIHHGFKGFYLCYQPFFDNQTLSLYGAEALLRFESPSRGKTGPGEFIPFLEQSGLICEVGLWVFQTAVRKCKEWRRWIPDFHMNVNISYIQLCQEGISYKILDILKEEGLPGDAVTMEVTESIQIQDSLYHNKIFYEWKKNGIRISIDDFGTGYSSLSYLKEFDIDEIKIDRTFVNQIQYNEQHYRLLKNMIDLAKEEGVRVYCEGVETEEEFMTVRNLNPDVLQGYLFAKPQTEKGFQEKFLLMEQESCFKKEIKEKNITLPPSLLQSWKADVLKNTNLGLWILYIDEETGRYMLYVDEVMRHVLGLTENLSEEECYAYWYNRINDGYYHYVNLAVESIIQTGKIVQLEYTWNHPERGEVTVRSMGVRVENQGKMICIQGYHRLVSELERPNFLPGGIRNEMFEYNEKKHTIFFHTERKIMAGDEKKEENFPECWIKKKIVHPHFEKEFRELFRDVQKKGEVCGEEFLIQSKSGSYEWVKLKTRHLGSKGRDAYTIVVLIEQAGQERAMELEYMRKSDFYEAMLSETVAFAEVDVESGHLTFAGGLWESYVEECQMKMMNFDQVICRHITDTVYPNDLEKYRSYMSLSYMKEMCKKGIHTQKYSFRRYVQGTLYWMELVLHVFQDHCTENIYALLYLKNIDSEKRRELAQEKAAERDPLTSVYNRSAFEQEVVRFMETKDAKGALIIMDIDNFKMINDHFGHLKGDETLKKMTEILTHTFRSRDVIGRLGGDEFLVFVKYVTSREIMDRRLNQLFLKFGEIKEITLTCSAGIQFVYGDHFSYKEALGKADMAMYESKKKGKNQYGYYE